MNTVGQQPGPRTGGNGSLFSSQPRRETSPLDATIAFAVAAAVVVAFSWWVGISLASLLPSVAIGLLIGWVRQWPLIRRHFREPVLSAVLGATWTKDRPRLAIIDICSALFVGYVVGVAFAWLAGQTSLPVYPLTALVIAGGAGGSGGTLDPGIFTFIVAILAVILVCMMLGMIAMILSAGLMRTALAQSGDLAYRAAEGAAQSAIENAATSWSGRHRGAFVEASIQGAMTGALICVALMIFGH